MIEAWTTGTLPLCQMALDLIWAFPLSFSFIFQEFWNIYQTCEFDPPLYKATANIYRLWRCFYINSGNVLVTWTSRPRIRIGFYNECRFIKILGNPLYCVCWTTTTRPDDNWSEQFLSNFFAFPAFHKVYQTCKFAPS